MTESNLEHAREHARYNMIEQQIRPWEVLDQRVLDTLAEVPREDFVPERYQRLAFTDVRIPLGHGQVMMNPNLEGRLLQALALQASDRILEIGTGSGYLTACMARLGRHVSSIDIYPDFTERAQQNLTRHGIVNTRLETGDGTQGWAQDNEQDFDAIAITGAMPSVSSHWRERLTVGGRLFVIAGAAPVMEALLITRTGEQDWLTESLFETDLPFLVNSVPAPEFEF